MFKESKFIYEDPIGSPDYVRADSVDNSGDLSSDAEKEAKQKEEMAREAEERRQIMAEAEQVLVREPEVSNEYTELTSKAKKFERSGGSVISESGALFSGIDSSLDFDVATRSTAVDELISNFEIPTETSGTEGEKEASSVDPETLKPSDADFYTPEGFMIAVSAVKAQDAKYKTEMSEIISTRGSEIQSKMKEFFDRLAVFNKDKTAWIEEGDDTKASLDRMKSEIRELIDSVREEIAEKKRNFKETTYVLETQVIEKAKSSGLLDSLNKKYSQSRESFGKTRQQINEQRNAIEAKKAELSAQSEGMKEYRKKIKKAKKKIDSGLSELSSVSSVTVDNSSKVSDLDAKISQIDQQLAKDGIAEEEKTTLNQIREELIARKSLYLEQESSASVASSSVASSIAKMNEDRSNLEEIDGKVSDYVDNKIPAKLGEIDGLLSKYSELDVKMDRYNEYFEKKMRDTFTDVNKTKAEVLTSFEKNREERDVSSFEWKLSNGSAVDKGNLFSMFDEKNAFLAFEQGLDSMDSSLSTAVVEEGDAWDSTVGTVLTPVTNALSFGIEGLSSISDLPGDILDSVGAPSWVHVGVDFMLSPIHASLGVTQGALGMAEGLLTVAKQPLQTVKGVGVLVGIGGDAGEAWGNLAKGLIYYDDWSWDVGSMSRAMGKIGFDVGLAVATGGSSATVSGGIKALKGLKYLSGVNKLRVVYQLPKALAVGVAKDTVSLVRHTGSALKGVYTGFSKRIFGKKALKDLSKVADASPEVKGLVKTNSELQGLEKQLGELKAKKKLTPEEETLLKALEKECDVKIKELDDSFAKHHEAQTKELASLGDKLKDPALSRVERLKLEKQRTKVADDLKELDSSIGVVSPDSYNVGNLTSELTSVESEIKNLEKALSGKRVNKRQKKLTKLNELKQSAESLNLRLGRAGRMAKSGSSVGAGINVAVSSVATVPGDALKQLSKLAKQRIFGSSLLDSKLVKEIIFENKSLTREMKALKKLRKEMDYLESIPPSMRKPGVLDDLKLRVVEKEEAILKQEAKLIAKRDKRIAEIDSLMSSKEIEFKSVTDVTKQAVLAEELDSLELLKASISEETALIPKVNVVESANLVKFEELHSSVSSRLEKLNEDLLLATQGQKIGKIKRLRSKIQKIEKTLGEAKSKIKSVSDNYDLEVKKRELLKAKTPPLSADELKLLDSEISMYTVLRDGLVNKYSLSGVASVGAIGSQGSSKFGIVMASLAGEGESNKISQQKSVEQGKQKRRVDDFKEQIQVVESKYLPEKSEDVVKGKK